MEICENLDLKNIDGEIWKEICGYDGDYFVSNFGRIKSFKKCYKIKEKILSPWKNDNGYLNIGLCKNGKVKHKLIHVLMYELFNNYKLKSDEVIHHIDESESNNSLDNFQLMDKIEHLIFHREGKHHSEKTKELMSEKMKGEKNHRSILTEQDVIQIRLDLDEGILTQKEIGEKFDVGQTTISMIKLRRIWKISQ